MSEVTRLIDAIRQGDASASAKLMPLVYQELRRLAQSQMARERRGHTLDATALVHEAYLRLFGDENVRWEGRGHFYAAAAEAMRRILIEHARARETLKRGGEHHRVELAESAAPIDFSSGQFVDVLAVNDALDKLELKDPGKANLVKLLYFAGLNLEEAGAVLGISRATAHRHWVFARAWLHEAISGGDPR